MLSRIKEYVFYTVKIYKNKPQKDFKAWGVRPVLNPPLTNERVRYITIVFKMLHSLGLFTVSLLCHTTFIIRQQTF